MIAILRKITLSDTYPVDYYINRHKLVGINPTLDQAVLPWLQATFDIYSHGSQINPLKREGEWHFTALTDKVCYVVFYYDTMETLNQIFSCPQMKTFEDSCNKLYPLIGWEEQGTKVIGDWDDTTPRNVPTMEALWNRS